jgi:hypothetical protein
MHFDRSALLPALSATAVMILYTLVRLGLLAPGSADALNDVMGKASRLEKLLLIMACIGGFACTLCLAFLAAPQ